ncbi:hypothetical protein K490DRAFT_63294 [Saccharata proteae CBS 121410]|uniref:Uncharacterized protein n=1 Tax=Saccharata proteae CBS 121410 TaxID=1314787 RepID=A0A9P4HZP6_9PEZI|nr:hypothetical protein K490DRAFT_63294 [Saccharata proteae CBS 121410]
MSDPRQIRFSQERITSPLDQRHLNPFPTGQATNFKTNVNRSKTKKWVEAKPYSYDGDDWGEYDEDDEYGVSQTPTPAPQAPTGLRQRGQGLANLGDRSFTDPQALSGGPKLARSNSFEAGDEKRAFSTSATEPIAPRIDTSVGPASSRIGASGPSVTSAPPPVVNTPSIISPTSNYSRDQYSAGPGSANVQHNPYRERSQSQSRQSSLNQSVASDASMYMDPQSRRDFSESALPPPLTMNVTPASHGRSESSEDELRSRGLRQQDSSERLATSRGRSPSIERDYDGGRGMRLAPLETVAERNSEYLPAFSLPQGDSISPPRGTANEPANAAAVSAAEKSRLSLGLPALPDVRPISGFGDNLFASGTNPNASSSTTPTSNDLAQANRTHQPEVGQSSPTTLQHQPSLGFRSAVQDAFKRTDGDSIPPTPVSKSNSLSASGSGMSRSNTDSTAGISPIMSRVPSGAHPAARAREESSTPAIAEEGTSRPGSAGTSYIVPRKPSPAHSRNVSGGTATPTGTRVLETPSPSQSPARSPALQSATSMPRPESGELGFTSPISSPSTNYAMREADLASPAKSNDRRASAQAAEEEKNAQSTFLENRKSVVTEPLPASPASRADSPSKGRVRDLADRYNADSRRNSAQSISSLRSNGSWAKEEKTSLPGSPTKESPAERPRPETNVSFRPKLPGTWESYATTAAPSTPGDIAEDRQLGSPMRDALSSPAPQPTPIGSPEKLEDADITPTTAKRPVSHHEPSGMPNPVEDPMAALAAAGAALGETIKSSIGMDNDKSDVESWEGSVSSDDELPKVVEEDKHRSVGDVYLRPLQLDRAASSVASSSPSPPPKDGLDEDMLLPAPLKSRSPSIAVEHELSTPTRPGLLPQLSSAPTAGDMESDRLRKEIVASLSPQTSFDARDENPTTGGNRASSILPREYDSYWNGDAGSQISRQSTRTDDAQRVTVSQDTAMGEAGRPGPLAHKFSWEQPSELSTPADAHPANTSASDRTLAQAANSPDMAEMPAGLAPSVGAEHVSVARSIAELPGRPTSSDGLHIVNPEPVDEADSPVELPAALPDPQHDVTGFSALSEPVIPTRTPSPLTQPATTEPARIPPFREILALKSADERIASYNSTRQQFAGMDTGLRAWVNSTLAAKPEHADLRDIGTKPIAMPISTNSGIMSSMRHRHGPSVSHIATGLRKGSASAATPGGTPYYQQYLDSASAVPAGNNSPTAVATQNSPNAAAGAGGNSRLDREKMQLKGKDLLKGAGVLGGKGVKEAKGLFAKGKSRFRGSGSDKAQRSKKASSTVPTPSSSIANTNPYEQALQSQSAAATPITEDRQLVAEAGPQPAVSPGAVDVSSPGGRETRPIEAKKRRFSPFGRRRSKSRSRSRPTSLALSLSSLFAGPETAKENLLIPSGAAVARTEDVNAVAGVEPTIYSPRVPEAEDHPASPAAVAMPVPINMAESNYVAPEAWDQTLEMPPSRGEEEFGVENLGVLPTPTTETSMAQAMTATAPLSPIADHHVLESVVRNSTPVSMTSGSEQLPGSRASMERIVAGDSAFGVKLGPRSSQETRKTLRSTPPLLPVPLDEVARKSLDANRSLGEDMVMEREFDVSPVDEEFGRRQGIGGEGSKGRSMSGQSDVSREVIGAGERGQELENDLQKEDDGEDDVLLAVKLAEELRQRKISATDEELDMQEPRDANLLTGPASTGRPGEIQEPAAEQPIQESEDGEDSAVRALLLAERLQNAGEFPEEPLNEDSVDPDRVAEVDSHDPQTPAADLDAEEVAFESTPGESIQTAGEVSLPEAKEFRDTAADQELPSARAMLSASSLQAISAAAAHVPIESPGAKESHADTTEPTPVPATLALSRPDIERPLSYMPLPRQDSGEPPQDHINQEASDPTRSSLEHPQYPLSSSSQYTRSQREQASEVDYAQDPQEFLSVSQRASQDTTRQAPSDPREHIYQQQMLSRGLEEVPPVPVLDQRPPPGSQYSSSQYSRRTDQVPEQRPPQGSQHSSSQYSRPTVTADQGEDPMQFYPPQRFHSSLPGTPDSQGRGQPMFARTLIDPRIHQTEFQLPGVGPPEPISSPESGRKSRTSLMRGRGGRTTPTPGMSVPLERINPAIAPHPQRTPSHHSVMDSPQTSRFPTREPERTDKASQQQQPHSIVHKKSWSRNFFRRHSSGSTATLAALTTTDPKADASSPKTPSSAGAATIMPSPPIGQTKAPAPAPEVVAAQLARKKSHNVLQRNPTSAEADKKKKRFSSFSNLFGRSATTAGVAQKPSKEEKKDDEKNLKKTESKGKLQKTQKLSERQRQSQGTLQQSAQQAYEAIPPVPKDLRGGQSGYEENRVQYQAQEPNGGTQNASVGNGQEEALFTPGTFSNSALDQREPTLPYIRPTPPPGDYEPQSAISEPPMRMRSPPYHPDEYNGPDMRYTSPPPPNAYYTRPPDDPQQFRYYTPSRTLSHQSHDNQNQQIARWPAQAQQAQRRFSETPSATASNRHRPPHPRHASTDSGAEYNYKLSPQISQISGPIRRLNSDGSDASSSVISPLEQRASPGFGGGQRIPDPASTAGGRAMRSISETAPSSLQQLQQQQERPWELSLPADEEDSDNYEQRQLYRGGPVRVDGSQQQWAGGSGYGQDMLPRGRSAENRWQEVMPDEFAAEQLRLQQRARQQGMDFYPSPPLSPRSYGPGVGSGGASPMPKIPTHAGGYGTVGIASGHGARQPQQHLIYDDDEDLYAEPTLPPPQPRPSTRGSGARMAPEVREEEEPVVMMGASYPGMEWTPGSGWDGRE